MTLYGMTGAEIDALVGANLRGLREEGGLDRARAAERMGLDPGRLAAVEAGQVRLNAVELSHAARVYRCSFMALFARPEPRRLAS